MSGSVRCACAVLLGVGLVRGACAETYSWTGGAGTFSLAAPDNWGRESVDFLGGHDFVLSGISANASLSCDTPIFANSLTLGSVNGTSSQWAAIRSSPGTGITVGAGGITVKHAVRYWDCPLILCVRGDQTWNIQNETYIAEVEGGLRDYDPAQPATVTKTGEGKLYFGHKNSTFSGTFVHESGVIVFQHENPMSESATYIMKGDAETARIELNSKAKLPFDMNLTLHSGHIDGRPVMKPWTTKESMEISGHITYGGVANKYLASVGNSGSLLVFSGGLTGSTGTRITFSPDNSTAPGKILVKNRPWVSTGYLMCASTSHVEGVYPEVEFAVAGNSFLSLGANNSSVPWWGSAIKTSVDWAFDNESMPVYVDDNAKFDLCGTTQRVGNVEIISANNAAVVNSSDRPATLYNNQAANWTHKGPFRGKLNLIKSGKGVHTFTMPCDVTGGIELLEGGIVLSNGATWRGATKVRLGSGTSLTISCDDALGDGAELVSDGGTLAFAGSGSATQTVYSCQDSTGWLAPGDYSADGRGETTQCPWLSGDGVLRVRHEGAHLVIVDGTLSVGAGETQYLTADMCTDEFSKIRLGAGAVLLLEAGLSFTVDSVTDDGVARPAGRHAFGDGVVFVRQPAIAATDATGWTGSVGTDMSMADNWSNPSASLVNGATTVTFALGGESACLSGSAFLNGIIGTTPFSVDSADAASRLALANGGISIAESGMPLTLNAPLEPRVSQTWNCASALQTAELVSDALDSRVVVTKTGPATLTVSDRGRPGSFTGSLVVEGGLLCLEGGVDLLGVVARDGTGGIDIRSGCNLSLKGSVITKPVSLPVPESPSLITGNPFATAPGSGRSVIGGLLSFAGGLFSVQGDSELCLTGGVKIVDSASLVLELRGGGSCTSSGCLEISGLPIADAETVRNSRGERSGERQLFGHVTFGVAGNRIRRIGANNTSHYWHSADIYLTADNAFDAEYMQYFYFGYDSLLDLCGTDQTVCTLELIEEDGKMPTVTNSSETPATLRVRQTNADWTERCRITGLVNFEVAAESTRKVTFVDRIDAVGSLRVAGGELVLSQGATWRGAESVSVGGNGRLTVNARNAFGRRTTLSLDAADNLMIGQGVTARVGKLVLDGKEQPLGEYRFGSGNLSVVGPGTVVIVR